MNTSLVISGYALYVFMGIFVILALGFIFYGCAYVKESREHNRTKRKYVKLRCGYNELVGMYQRDSFAVPDLGVKEEIIKFPIITADTGKVPKFILENSNV